MSRKILRVAALSSVLGLTNGAVYAQQPCDKCDCIHPPVPPKCEKCCGVATGKITSVTDTGVVLTRPTQGGKSVEQAFALDKNTTRNASLKKGAEATVYFAREKGIAKRVDLTEALEGLLQPTNEPDPPDACPRLPPPPESMKIFLGNTSATWTTGDQTAALRFGKQEVLSVRRTAKGMAVSAAVFSADGRAVAQIIDNHFYINPNNSFRSERSDPSSLVVYDQKAQEVLRIRYLNPLSVKITGIFYSPKGQLILVKEDEILINRNTFRHICGGNVQTLFAVE